MPITFEEKSNVGKNIAILSVVVLAIAIAGFFGWNFLQQSPTEIPAGATNSVGIDKTVLENPDLATLDLFPEIVPAEIATANKNPFAEQQSVEQSATTSVPVAK